MYFIFTDGIIECSPVIGAVRLIGRYRDVLRGLIEIVEMTEDPNDPQVYVVIGDRRESSD